MTKMPYIMIYHDVSWYAMICHEISWYIMICHDISRYVPCSIVSYSVLSIAFLFYQLPIFSTYSNFVLSIAILSIDSYSFLLIPFWSIDSHSVLSIAILFYSIKKLTLKMRVYREKCSLQCMFCNRWDHLLSMKPLRALSATLHRGGGKVWLKDRALEP